MYQIIRSRIEYLVIIILTTVLVAVVITLATPSEYEGSARILVVQKQQSVDAFSASKSADYIAGVLNEAIYSNSFTDSLVKTDSSLASKLSNDVNKRSKEWAKKVDSSVISNKGILIVKAYDGDSAAALHITSLIVSTLTSEGASYYGGNNTIELRVIDNPSVTAKPARPSLPLNVAAATLIGLALDVVYVFIVDVRFSRKLDEREYFGKLHDESEVSRDMDFLRDGHVAHTPTAHVVAENFGNVNSVRSGMQTNNNETEAPRNVPLTEESEEQIQNWIQKR
jgi:capsular polysaccharide biosynthesis protein